jgi:hypothetical protein
VTSFGSENALSYVVDQIGPQGACSRRIFRIKLEDAAHEINESVKWKGINDKHKAMILGENAKRFYNL